MIDISGLNKSYGRRQVLKNIGITLNSNHSISLIGPNGSGKTTLIKCILGMVVPDKGQILFEGKSIKSSWKYRENIGYMPQISRYPPNLKVGKLFKMICEIRGVQGEKTDQELIESLGLKNFFNNNLGTLSGGTLQKVSACIAFLFEPAVLILDEPTAGLDPLSTEILKEKINKERQRGKLVLVTSHILSDLEEITQQVIYIHEGEIRFFREIESIKKETGEIRLHKAIARMMKENASLRYD